MLTYYKLDNSRETADQNEQLREKSHKQTDSVVVVVDKPDNSDYSLDFSRAIHQASQAAHYTPES